MAPTKAVGAYMNYLRRWGALASVLVLMAACGGSGGGDGADAMPAPVEDADGDGISDDDEGRAEAVDTDGDGTPDFEDTDSDGDGIPDSVEAGDDDGNTPPIDSDGDGTPDFRDLDSDANGILDADDGEGDVDSDGIGDYADLDDDGDGLNDITELGGTPESPPDTDGDGTPNHQDTDSDNDTILDLHEGASDPDLDMIPAYLDDDSDGDCLPDSVEAGDADPNTPPVDTDGDTRADFLDLDADNDGLVDSVEDPNCNGVVDTGETNPFNEDSDGDGVSDLVEVAAGTDPNDMTDNPQANGDFVFVVPYEGAPDPAMDDLDFSTTLKKVDVYVLVDRSGSMTGEITSIANNIQTVADNITCPPLGSGDPADCIPDIWWGAGMVGYRGTNGASYSNFLDMQPNPSLVSGAMTTAEPSGCCDEPLLLGTYSALTGAGSTGDGTCTVNTAYGARGTCVGSPADGVGAGGLGYPCFRDDALPVILLTTDEPPTGTYNCPSTATVVAAANAIGAKIIGIKGTGSSAQTDTDLSALATGTGAVDALNGNAPLVVDSTTGGAADAIETAIRLMANGIELDISAETIDDPSDSVDAVASFVDHLQTLQLGTAACTNGLSEDDSTGDGFNDRYLSVIAGTPVCWQLVPKSNTTVMPTAVPQLFMATIVVSGDGITTLDTRDVFFLVPPENPDIPID